MNKVLIFALGAAIGSFVTWKLVKIKYEQIANDEIEAVKEVYHRSRSENNEEQDEIVKPEADGKKAEDLRAYNNFVKKYTGKNEEVDMSDLKPYVIPPDQFGEMDDYETISLNYYADGVLADDMDDEIEADDVEMLVGRDSLKHFGEYEMDSVFVRNDALKTDYEILLDLRNYSEVKKLYE